MDRRTLARRAVVVALQGAAVTLCAVTPPLPAPAVERLALLTEEQRAGLREAARLVGPFACEVWGRDRSDGLSTERVVYERAAALLQPMAEHLCALAAACHSELLELDDPEARRAAQESVAHYLVETFSTSMGVNADEWDGVSLIGCYAPVERTSAEIHPD